MFLSTTRTLIWHYFFKIQKILQNWTCAKKIDFFGNLPIFLKITPSMAYVSGISHTKYQFDWYSCHGVTVIFRNMVGAKSGQKVPKNVFLGPNCKKVLKSALNSRVKLKSSTPDRMAQTRSFNLPWFASYGLLNGKSVNFSMVGSMVQYNWKKVYKGYFARWIHLWYCQSL